jgi:hypothetical protein
MTLKGHSKFVHAIVSVDSQTVWSCSEDMTVCVWTSLGIMRHQIKLKSKLLTLLAVERHIWVGDRDGHIVIYDTSTLSPVDTLDDVHSGACNALCLVPVPDSLRVSVWSGAMDRAVVAFTTPYSYDSATGRYSASSEIDPKAHDWLKVKFKATTVCKKCKHDIWSLVSGRQGLVCRKCKIAVHKKCALDLEGHECVRRVGPGSAVARKSAQRARRTVQFGSAQLSELDAEIDAAASPSLASTSAPAVAASASGAAAAVAAPAPTVSMSASAASALTPVAENEVMNEALRLRNAEGERTNNVRRRSDSNPVLLAAGLRDASQRGSARSPSTSRRAIDEAGGEAAAAAATDALQRTVSVPHGAPLVPAPVPADKSTLTRTSTTDRSTTLSRGNTGGSEIVTTRKASPMTQTSGSDVVRSSPSRAEAGKSSPRAADATVADAGAGAATLRSPRPATPPLETDDDIAALVDGAAAQAKAEVVRNATLNDSSKSSDGGSKAKKLNRLTAVFKKSPDSRPTLERHNTLDLPSRTKEDAPVPGEVLSPGRGRADSDSEPTDPPPAGDGSAPGGGEAEDTQAPVCERCKQRKAKARVTMPNGVQSLMCRRCTTEVQQISKTSKSGKSAKPKQAEGTM